MSELELTKAELARVGADFEKMRASVYRCLDGGAAMSEHISRLSGSVYDSTISAPRWWWILRHAMEQTWDRYGKDVGKGAEDEWNPDARKPQPTAD